jgi:DNA-binding response OmpR family regulator
MARILVIDDDRNTCDLLTRTLAKEGFEVVAENSPLDAIRSFKDNSFDLLIL